MGSSLLPDVSTIKGNLTQTQKLQAAQTLAHFIGTPDTSFGADIGSGLKLVEIDVFRPYRRAGGDEYEPSERSSALDRDGGGFGQEQIAQVANEGKQSGSVTEFEGRTICEIQVTKNMCNVYGTLHGGCAAYLIDPCSVSAIVGLGIVAGIDGTGVSQSMNIQWHRPAKMGAKLRIISSTVSVDGYIRSARCELRDSVDNALYVSAVHSTIMVNARRAVRDKSKPKAISGAEGSSQGKSKL